MRGSSVRVGHRHGQICFGTIEVKLLTLKKMPMKRKLFSSTDFGWRYGSGKSDAWGQMTRDKILHGWLKDREGKILGETVKYLDIERHIKFPEAEIFIRQEGNRLYLLADHFARCVVLEGKEKKMPTVGIFPIIILIFSRKKNTVLR